jgi:hypothetical protein
MFGCFEMQGEEMSFVISVHFNDRIKSSFMIKTISNTEESKRTSIRSLSAGSENPYTITLITQTEPNSCSLFLLNDPSESDVILNIINPPRGLKTDFGAKKELP